MGKSFLFLFFKKEVLRKAFFFEKKKQKTFVDSGVVWGVVGVAGWEG